MQRVLAQFAVHVLAFIILVVTGMIEYSLVVYVVAMIATSIANSFDK